MPRCRVAVLPRLWRPSQCAGGPLVRGIYAPLLAAVRGTGKQLAVHSAPHAMPPHMQMTSLTSHRDRLTMMPRRTAYPGLQSAAPYAPGERTPGGGGRAQAERGRER